MTTARKSLAKPTISAVDLFCGAGGLTHGLINAGIDVRLGVDVDPACEFPYVANNKSSFMMKPVEDLQSQEVAAHFAKGSFRLLAGCAPCQAFSSYNPKADKTDSRWGLLRHFAKLAAELLPEFVTMENVPRLRHQRVFREFERTLEKRGYGVSSTVVNCAEYGVPQHRSRLVLLASRLGPVSLLSPEAVGKGARTVREAIAGLPTLAAGEVCAKDPLHRSAALSPINLKRIKASTPGGAWRDWPESLRADCHKRRGGKTFPSVYGRMAWDEPAPTMTTQYYAFGSGRFGHPQQHRAISLREGAILQGFPKGYKFTRRGEPITRKAIGRLVGNAVPIALGEVIGASLVSHIGEHGRAV